MSRPVSSTGTETLIPSSYTEGSNMTTNTSYPTSNGFANASSTTYAQFTAPNGSLGYCYYEIDTSVVPENATSITVSCTVKICVSNSSGHSTATIQMYSGNTAKGSATSFYNSTSTSTRTMSVGTWTRSELENARFRIEGQRNTSSNRYIRFYGATITVNWTISGTEYETTIVNNVSGVTTDPSGTTYVFQNDDTIIEINGITDLNSVTITDNGTDIKNQLTYVPPNFSENIIASGYTNLSSGVTINSSYPITNTYRAASNSGSYTRLDFSTSTTGYIELLFDIPDIPSNATITSITAKSGLRVSSTTRMTNTICRLYSGSTAKGSNTTFATTTATVYNLTPGTWTVSELSDLRMRIGATSSSSTSSKYIYMYGAEITINYELENGYYTYTISNISADHTIVIESADSTKIYIKVNGSWVQYSKVYKKINGSWVEQSDLSNLFDSDKIYIKN